MPKTGVAKVEARDFAGARLCFFAPARFFDARCEAFDFTGLFFAALGIFLALFFPAFFAFAISLSF
jgi:hypothetical protein